MMPVTSDRSGSQVRLRAGRRAAPVLSRIEVPLTAKLGTVCAAGMTGRIEIGVGAGRLG